MGIRAKRRDNSFSWRKFFNRCVRRLYSFLNHFLITVSFLCMPPLLVWALVLTVIGDLFSVLRVLAMLVVCLLINIYVEVK